MRQSLCKSCGAPIVWAKTENDKNMPLDAATVTEGQRYAYYNGASGQAYCVRVTGDEPGHASHFASCPKASAHRRVR